MNKAFIIKILGFILLIEAVLMLAPIITGLVYGESDWVYFLYTLIGEAIVGGAIAYFVKPKRKKLHPVDGFLVVACAWVLLSAVGAIPFCLCGAYPDYLDALFEMVSGFTTTGITIVPDVEILSHSVLIFRSLSQWIGGMGVLVFVLALGPVAGGSSFSIYKAEAPGPVKEKITSKISTSAKYLYLIYILLTAVEFVALVISGVAPFTSLNTAFTTMATGGFGIFNDSLASFTMGQQIIVEIFMFLAAVNFALLFLAFTGKFKRILKNTEFWVYLTIIILFAAAISYNTISVSAFNTAGEAIHHSIFGVISSLSSTGFSSTDMNVWPWFSKGLIILLMYIGGCAGSTAGGVKVSRFVIVFKAAFNYLKELAHPRTVREITFNKKKLRPEFVRNTLIYFSLLIVISITSMIIVSQDPTLDFSSSFAAVATTLNNNGIDFHGVSVGGYITFEWYTKIVFIFDMLIGRLEIFPILILLMMIFSPVGKIKGKFKKKIK